MSISTVYAHIAAFFTAEDLRIEQDYGEIHAVIANLGARVKALEEKLLSLVQAQTPPSA